MERIYIAPRVAQAHTRYRPGVLLAENIDASRADGAFIGLLADETLALLASQAHRHQVLTECAAWRDVYRQMGLKSSKVLCSLEALHKRIAKGFFPRIHPVVDLYNLASLRFALCFGAYDTHAVRGAIEIRYGSGETMEPIGGGSIFTQAAHVVYADAVGPLCAYWNHRDADRSKVTIQTTSVIFFADELDSEQGRAAHALKALGEWLRAAFGPQIRLSQPAVEMRRD